MNKKISLGIVVALLVLTLLSFSVSADIFATIGMKGLSFASPQAAGVVQNVMKAYQITADPSGFITGEITGKLTGEVMGEIAKQSPEAAKAIQQYQQVDGWVKEGAKINEDLKLDDKGRQVGGSITLNQKQNVESLTDKKIGDIQNMALSTKGEKEPYQLKASENGASATIGGNTYSNLQKGSTINVDRETGKVDEMDATFTKATTIKVNDDEIKVPEGARVVYKEGRYDVYGKDQEVEINKQKIQINGENSINYDGKKITGKDFTLDEKRFTGMEGKNAEVTITDKGYVLGKNTIAENERMTVTSEKGNVLYAKMCGDVSGFNNYVNPCTKKLTAEGDGFSVQLKEGKQFGLDIKKDGVLKYEMKGGELVLDDGLGTITTQEKKSVIVTNGELVTVYTKIDGTNQVLVEPNTLGGDVDVNTITKHGDKTVVTDDEMNTQSVYNCPESGTNAIDTTASAIITGNGALSPSSPIGMCFMIIASGSLKKSFASLNTGEGLSKEWKNRRTEALSQGLCTENQYFLGKRREWQDVSWLQPSPPNPKWYTSGEIIGDRGVLVKAIKDPKTKEVLRYELVTGETYGGWKSDPKISFKSLGNGKVELIGTGQSKTKQGGITSDPKTGY